MECVQLCEAPLERLRRPISALLTAFAAAEQSTAGGVRQIPETLMDEAFSAFDQLNAEFNRLIATSPASTAAALGNELQKALLPFIRMARTARRFYEKPLGYAGDYLTISQIYEDSPDGEGGIGKLVDAYILSQPPAIAVRNRRALLCDYIEKLAARRGGRPVRIASLACGPACEVFDLYANSELGGLIQTTLIDIDRGAIAKATERIDALNLQDSVHCMICNLALVAIGRMPLNLRNQDLVYSIGLIDYFEDDVVIGLLDAIHDALAPGGSVVVGNFHPDNPARQFMDRVLEWNLIHRTEDDIRRLFLASAFRRAPDRIFYESQRINLFAECYRDDS